MAAGQPLAEADRWPWLDQLQDSLRRSQSANEGLVVACSALRRSYRQHLRRAGDVTFVFLDGPAELIAERLTSRAGHYMPPSLLGSQLQTLERPHDAVVVDMRLAPAAQVGHVCRALDLSPQGR
jgi:gluconokinase